MKIKFQMTVENLMVQILFFNNPLRSCILNKFSVTTIYLQREIEMYLYFDRTTVFHFYVFFLTMSSFSTQELCILILKTTSNVNKSEFLFRLNVQGRAKLLKKH